MEYILAHPEHILQHPSGTTHILSLITYLPLLGAIIIALFLPRGNQRAVKVVATLCTVLTFVLSLVMLSHFQGGTHKLQLVEYADWIPSIGVAYFFGVDGLSILLVLLTTLLSVIVVVCSYSQIEENEKAYYACLLFLETGMLGVFMALDFFLLHLLGNHAGAHVFPHWHLGAWPASVLSHQILFVYAVRFGVHALRYSGALLLQWESRLWHWQTHL
jgi:hypothetical protein